MSEDDDLESWDREALIAEVRRLRGPTPEEKAAQKREHVREVRRRWRERVKQEKAENAQKAAMQAKGLCWKCGGPDPKPVFGYGVIPCASCRTACCSS